MYPGRTEARLIPNNSRHCLFPCSEFCGYTQLGSRGTSPSTQLEQNSCCCGTNCTTNNFLLRHGTNGGAIYLTESESMCKPSHLNSTFILCYNLMDMNAEMDTLKYLALVGQKH